MNNLTQTKENAKAAYLNTQAETMLAHYQTVNLEERKAVIKQIDSLLSVVSQDEKIFWLKFRQKLIAFDEPKFCVGKVFLTIGAREALEESNQSAMEFLTRHESGDWGDVDKVDAAENELSLKEGFRIMSVYRTKLQVKIWIITEADRSSTTLLLPDEY